MAYRIPNSQFYMNKTGKHLTAKEFNTLIDEPNSVIIDMRNHYESEVWHFKNAINPDIDRSQDLLKEIILQYQLEIKAISVLILI